MILDWSHSYQDNNICQQVTPNNNKPEEFFKSLSSSQSSVNKHCRSQSIWTCYCFLHISVFLIIQCVFSVCLHVGSWVGRFMHAYMHGCADVWVSKGWVGVGVEGDVWKATPVQEPGDIHCLPWESSWEQTKPWQPGTASLSGCWFPDPPFQS